MVMDGIRWNNQRNTPEKDEKTLCMSVCWNDVTSCNSWSQDLNQTL